MSNESSAGTIPFIDLANHIFEPEVLRLIPAEIARKYQLIPAYRIRDFLTVVMARPDDITALDEIRRLTKLNIIPAVGSEEDIRRAIEVQYGAESTETGVDEELPVTAADGAAAVFEEIGSADSSAELLAEKAPVVRFVDQILFRAVREQASDIHFEPDAGEFRIRFRIDGVLHTVNKIPQALSAAVSSRVKIMAHMDIAEKRRPQDGQFPIAVDGRSVDVRVSSFPTIYGENIVLRLLDKESVNLGLNELGLTDDVREQFARLLHQPYGIILVTGPTGSGKTTTLYAGLQTINSEERNIVTLEDPVEYRLPLVRQSQVNVKAGVTFASGLRAILRQDPDVIMVGEIRDAETAQIAVQAALTGHLVLSTLHTNDAASAVTRLIDMGIEPFLVSSSLLGVIAQRLVRKICPKCRIRGMPLPDVVQLLELPQTTGFYKGRGCLRCRSSGYSGRIGVFELLVVDDDIRRLSIQRVSPTEIARQAIKAGMKTMRQDAIAKALAGITTPDEVLRATRAG